MTHEDTSFTVRVSHQVQPPSGGILVDIGRLLGVFKRYRWDVYCYHNGVHQWHQFGYAFTSSGAAREAGRAIAKHSDA